MNSKPLCQLLFVIVSTLTLPFIVGGSLSVNFVFMIILESKKTSHHFFTSIKSTLILAIMIKFKTYLQICISTLMYSVHTLSCHKSLARMCKPFRSQGIDSQESIKAGWESIPGWKRVPDSAKTPKRI
jgi:hypothetical protein